MAKCVEHSNLILYCLIDCALEYTMDHRGDVGVWVREAAINGLEVCIITNCMSNTLVLHFINFDLFILGSSIRFD